MSDPIDSPKFNPATYRAPNPDTIAHIERLGQDYQAALDVARELRNELNTAVVDAKRAGHSYPQLSRASGMAITTIQRMVDSNRGWE